jgi:ABC-2 type transport system permease protein
MAGARRGPARSRRPGPGRWLPVRPFNEALTGPLSRHAGADWRHLAVLAARGIIGAAVAVRRFRWDPRPE